MTNGYQPGDFLDSLQAAGPAPAGADCPGEERLSLLAVGLVSAPEAAHLLAHAAGCDCCGARLREAVEDLATPETEEEREFAAQSRLADPERRRQFAMELAGLQEPWWTKWFDWIRNPLTVRLAPAGALAGLVALFTPSLIQHISLARAERATNQAYVATHRLPLRFSGVDYSRVSVEMGGESSHLSQPAELFDAEGKVKSGIDSRPNDPRWLQLQGRLDLLVGQEDAAIAELERAQALRPQDRYLLSDLGAARYQKAEKHQDPKLYADAFEAFSKGLALKPNDPVLLFNKALAAEHLYAFNEAKATWEAYLQIDSRSGWAQDARTHLDAIKKKLERQRSYAAATTPETLLAELRTGKSWNQLFAPDEEYLKVAITHLLPAWYARPPDKSAGAILQRMADMFIKRHQDTWLRDVLRTPRSPPAWVGFRALAAAVEAADAGQWENESNKAQEAVRIFRSTHNRAGELRAKFDYVQALYLVNQPCRGPGQSLETTSRQTSYTWLQLQAIMTLTICELQQVDFERAWTQRQAAIHLAKQSHYPFLLLRALGLNASWQMQIGNTSSALKQYVKALDQYWSAAYPLLRAQSIYAPLSLLAPRISARYSAVTWARETLETTASLHIPSYRAGALHQLALAEMSAGMSSNAEVHFSEHARLVASLPQSQQRVQMTEMSVERADAEAAIGLLDAAQVRLEGVRADVDATDHAILQLQLSAVLGRVELGLGEYAEAERLFTRALAIGVSPRPSLSSADQASWTRALGDAYRGLAECNIRRGVPPRQSWSQWSNYRAALSNQPPPSNVTAPPVGPGEALLSIADLPSGIAVWLYTPHDFHFQWLPRTTSDTAGRLIRDCTNPEYPLPILRAEAADLSATLLGPWQRELDAISTLIVESDGPLSAVPWPALVLANGRYWSEEFAIRIRVGAGARTQPLGPVASARSILAVGAPTIEGDNELPPIPGARAEAEKISALFPRYIKLIGREATLSEVRNRIADAEIFHFVGHGYGGEGGGLILRGAGGGPALLTAADLQDLHLRGCRLAVLSACSSGAGERDDDPQSLVRAFLHGGTGEVVASFWNLNSTATELLIDRFYTGILAQTPAEESLRMAAAVVRMRSEYRHPYYWAGLQVFSLH